MNAQNEIQQLSAALQTSEQARVQAEQLLISATVKIFIVLLLYLYYSDLSVCTIGCFRLPYDRLTSYHEGNTDYDIC